EKDESESAARRRRGRALEGPSAHRCGGPRSTRAGYGEGLRVHLLPRRLARLQGRDRLERLGEALIRALHGLAAWHAKQPPRHGKRHAGEIEPRAQRDL